MIDSDNLRTASLYINNQLLSRGLLRDGQSIDFANPTTQDGETGVTMGRIVSVVNDLILRRDRDAEHRESLSVAMRTLRAENLKHTNDVARLTEKHAEAKRKLEIAEASEASLRTQMKSADAAVRGLKEEMARTKGLVAQARSACANEVRRRDRQIETLKKQLGEAGRARGSRGNSTITTITVTGNVGDDKGSPVRNASTATFDGNLRGETNTFLAKLAQDLSEENEAILNIMQRTMQQLREMSGWSPDGAEDGLVVKHQGLEAMSAELDSVLAHMRTILTNPSFVPIEEVMVREEEISHLKDGWVKMEQRWTEAVHLIDGWRKRMAASGRPVCDEELQMSLRLSPVRVRNVAETMQPREFRLSAVAEEAEEEHEDMPPSPCPAPPVPPQLEEELGDEDDESDEDSDFDTHGALEDYDEDEPNVQILQQSTAVSLFQRSMESPPLPEPPQLSPLRDSGSAGNRGPLKIGKGIMKPVDFTTIMEEDTRDLARHTSSQKSTLSIRPVASEEATGEMKEHDEAGRDRTSTASLEDALLAKAPAEDPLEPEKRDRPRSLSRRRFQSPGCSSNDSAHGSRPHVESPTRSPRRNASRRRLESPDCSGNDSGHGTRPRLESPTRTPRRNASRLPLPRNEAAPPGTPLTMAAIASKLAASEKEADAARVRAKLKAARGARGVKKPTLSAPQPEPTASQTVSTQRAEAKALPASPSKRDLAPSEDKPKPEKRKRERRTNKVASRRRSTLSPWELESLIAGNVQ